MADDLSQIEEVRREVADRTVDGGAGRVLLLRTTFAAAEDDVWRACTDPARVGGWFVPLTGDLRAGGRYQLEGNAGGEILVCDAPHHLALTWEYAEQVSWVDLRLTGEGDKRTQLQLEHTAPLDEGMWAEFGPGAVGIGWDMILLGLAMHLRGESFDGPEAAMAWQMSEDGRAFATASSDRWVAASVAAGTPPEEATAAGDRVLTTYTEAPPSPDEVE